MSLRVLSIYKVANFGAAGDFAIGGAVYGCRGRWVHVFDVSGLDYSLWDGCVGKERFPSFLLICRCAQMEGLERCCDFYLFMKFLNAMHCS